MKTPSFQNERIRVSNLLARQKIETRRTWNTTSLPSGPRAHRIIKKGVPRIGLFETKEPKIDHLKLRKIYDDVSSPWGFGEIELNQNLSTCV